MFHKEISEKQASAWLAAALAAPLAQTASACTWPVVLLAGGVCLLTCWALSKYPAENSRWLQILQGIWSCVVISEVLHWTIFCWPDQRSGYAIPLILLFLAAWAADRAARVGCVLLWPVLLLLGAVLLSGIPELALNHLTPTWLMPNAHLITVALIPALCTSREGKTHGKVLWGMLLFALLTAAVTAGVLSPAVSGDTQAPVYELSRSIRLLGIAKRLESLIAAAMTLGYFVTLTYLLNTGGRSRGEKKTIWVTAAASAILLLSGLRIDSRLMAIGSILFWVVLPVISGWKKNFKKTKKELDK